MELKLAKTVLGLAIALIAWGAIIRWSAHKLVEHVNEKAKDPRYQLKMEVKDFEIQEIDMDAWRQNFGMTPDQ
jgi:hypothetical protein